MRAWSIEPRSSAGAPIIIAAGRDKFGVRAAAPAFEFGAAPAMPAASTPVDDPKGLRESEIFALSRTERIASGSRRGLWSPDRIVDLSQCTPSTRLTSRTAVVDFECSLQTAAVEFAIGRTPRRWGRPGTPGVQYEAAIGGTEGVRTSALIQSPAGAAAVRKDRPFSDGFANASSRSIAPVQEWSYGRAGRGRESGRWLTATAIRLRAACLKVREPQTASLRRDK